MDSIYIERPDRKQVDDRGCEKRKTVSINGGIPENVRSRHVTVRAHTNINWEKVTPSKRMWKWTLINKMRHRAWTRGLEYKFRKIGPSPLVWLNGTDKPNEEWLIEWLMMVSVWFQKGFQEVKNLLNMTGDTTTPEDRQGGREKPRRQAFEESKTASIPLWKRKRTALSEQSAFSAFYDNWKEFDREIVNRKRVMCSECITGDRFTSPFVHRMSLFQDKHLIVNDNPHW